MQQGPVNSETPPTRTQAGVSFTASDARRIGKVVLYAERLDRSRPQPADERPRETTRPGAYAYIAGSVGGASTSTLGTGSGVLCSRVGTALTADGETVTLYNAGGGFTGPVYAAVAWVDGDWTVAVVPCS